MLELHPKHPAAPATLEHTPGIVARGPRYMPGPAVFVWFSEIPHPS